MRTACLCALALSGLASLALSGCGTPMQNCGTITYTITPVSASLDHTVANNAQQYTLNVIVPQGCSPPPYVPVHAPVWSVSNTTAATITTTGIASCKAAASAPITVSAEFPGATATLICK
jgi:hypothetical protein